ncbi:MAG: GNAT family N-acetyltransferase [Myxococcales bacterium]|nr:GNAT family N-acetyltransferase [Myxococcales bacterium]
MKEQLSNFVVLDSDAGLIGAGGLELYGREALLRALVVSRENRGQGVARKLCDRLESKAREQGAVEIYLLTETAQDFFARRGYLLMDRAEAPPSIRECAEFADLCPDSAVLMHRTV